MLKSIILATMIFTLSNCSQMSPTGIGSQDGYVTCKFYTNSIIKIKNDLSTSWFTMVDVDDTILLKVDKSQIPLNFEVKIYKKYSETIAFLKRTEYFTLNKDTTVVFIENLEAEDDIIFNTDIRGNK